MDNSQQSKLATGEDASPDDGGNSVEEEPRELFRLQVLEDLEEERALLYRFLAIGLLISLAIWVRQIVLSWAQGSFL